MSVYIFVSPSLIFKNSKIYLLSDINDFLEDFEKNTYYIDFTEISTKGNFVHKNIKIAYEIITPIENKNLSVKIDYDEESFKNIEISECIDSFEKFVSGINNDFLENLST